MICQPAARRILACDKTGRTKTWLTDIDAHGVAFTASGNAYVTDPVKPGIWLIRPTGERHLVAQNFGRRRGCSCGRTSRS